MALPKGGQVVRRHFSAALADHQLGAAAGSENVLGKDPVYVAAAVAVHDIEPGLTVT
jgi:hypothetical protein